MRNPLPFLILAAFASAQWALATDANTLLVVPAGATSATATLTVSVPLSTFSIVKEASPTLVDDQGRLPPYVSFSAHGSIDTTSTRYIYFIADLTAVPRSPFKIGRASC